MFSLVADLCRLAVLTTWDRASGSQVLPIRLGQESWMLNFRVPARILGLPKTRAHCRRSLSSATSTSESLKPYYITTPIFYPNAGLSPNFFSFSESVVIQLVVPHVGHLYSLVMADIFARFQRLQNPSRPVHFLTGTDEHGLKIQKAATMRNLEPGVFCDELSEQFRVCSYSRLAPCHLSLKCAFY